MKPARRDELIRAMFDDDMRLLQSKGKDYAGDVDALQNFRTWGVMGIAVRMDDKMARLRNIVKSGRVAVAGESLEDTLRDLSNYAFLARVVLAEAKEQMEGKS